MLVWCLIKTQKRETSVFKEDILKGIGVYSRVYSISEYTEKMNTGIYSSKSRNLNIGGSTLRFEKVVNLGQMNLWSWVVVQTVNGTQKPPKL